jgi:DNA-binding NarL/FixJ family response regulator
MTLDVLQPATARNRIRVAVFDRRPLAADGFAALLEQSGDVQIVGVETSARSAVRLLTSTAVDVVVVGVTSAELITMLRLLQRIPADQRATGPRIVEVVSGDQDVADMIGGPSVTAITSTVDAETLREVVVSATAGGVATIPASAFRRSAVFETTTPKHQGLTPREQEVLRSIENGLSTNEIAEDLGIAPNTVRTHAQRLMSKLAVHSRVQAAAIAARDDHPLLAGG